MCRRNGGLTLIELLVVLLVILTLALIAIPPFLNARLRADVARVNQDLQYLESAIEFYYLDHKRYPESSDDLVLSQSKSGNGDSEGLLRLTTPGDFVSGDDGWNMSSVAHPILTGPFANLQGAIFSATGYDDDAFGLGVGTIALAEMDNAQVRLSLNELSPAAGSVGYWNGGLSGTGTNAQPDFSSGGNTQNLFLNYAAWATSTSVPEPTTMALLGIGLAGVGWRARRAGGRRG